MSGQNTKAAKTVDESTRVQRTRSRFRKDMSVAIASGALTAAFTVGAGMMIFSGGQTVVENFGQNKHTYTISSGEMTAGEKGLAGFLMGAFAGISGLITLVAASKAHHSHHRAQYVREIVAQEYANRVHNEGPALAHNRA